MNKVRIILVLLIVFSTSVHCASTDTYLWKESGDWTIRIDPTLGNKCFIFASYPSSEDWPGKSFIRAGINEDNESAYMMIYSSEWKSLEIGKIYEIKIQFDKEVKWEADAVGNICTFFADANLPDNITIMA